VKKERNRSVIENAEVLDVTVLTQNPKALKKLLMAQIRAQGGTGAVDSKSIVSGLIKQTLEAFLELEMEEHLGYPQYDAEGPRQRQLPQWQHSQNGAWRIRRSGNRNTARPQR
jgi:hypothetical protein